MDVEEVRYYAEGESARKIKKEDQSQGFGRMLGMLQTDNVMDYRNYDRE